jgi:hypothetical protein
MPKLEVIPEHSILDTNALVWEDFYHYVMEGGKALSQEMTLFSLKKKNRTCS